MVCTVSYTIVNSSGVAIPNAVFIIQKAIRIQAGATNVRFSSPQTITANGSGAGTFDAVPGNYVGISEIGAILQGGKSERFSFAVPDSAAADLEDIIDTVAPEVFLPTLAALNAAVASASASSAAAGAASGRLDVGSFAELATKFVKATPGAGDQVPAVGDIALFRGTGAAYEFLADAATEFDFDYTGSGGWKIKAVTSLAAPQSVVKYGLNFGAANARPELEAALLAAGRASRVGAREVIIRGGGTVNISTHVNIPAKVRLVFDGDARLNPVNTNQSLIRAYGAVPATTYALTADAARYSDRLTVGSTNIAAFTVGDWVWFTSTFIINTSPNINDLTIAQKAKVVAKTATHIILDRLVEYAFLTADTATVGVMTCLDGIRIENAGLSGEGGGVYLRGIDARFCDDISVIGTRGGYSRAQPDPDGTYSVTNSNLIGFKSCSDVLVQHSRLTRSGFYGIEIDGACHGVTIKDTEGSLCRHVISLNWNGPGEPIGVLIDDTRSSRTQLNAVDTHDVGRDITIRKTRDTGSFEGPGMQIRTSRVLIDDYVGEGHSTNGLLVWAGTGGVQSRLKDIRARHIDVRNNGTRGILSQTAIDIDGVYAEGNGLSATGTPNSNDVGGVHIVAGRIANGRIINNRISAICMGTGIAADGQRGRVIVENIDAPQTANQTIFCATSTPGFTPFSPSIKNCTAVGYTTATLFDRLGASAVIEQVDLRESRFSTDALTFTAILVAGEVTVSNGNIVVESIFGTGRLKTQISVMRTELRSATALGELFLTLSDGQVVIQSRRADGTIETNDISRVECCIA